ncbi:hypothetical protein [Paraburkholderia metrosideri]|uniref:Uncharacterized protein n=1 Tax=Paraburkholderia metrosideri TaxID=580937 RepID=A0ABN7I207_9BURK|nr:hypothetical protein [Paraburkholderia metrosideri]CAD6549168.1 hypothetical protein LMG28140_04718 [Paraburkholderia metrosideri]
MALTQSTCHFADQAQSATPSQSLGNSRVQRSNVIPFPSTRALLQVTLPHPSNDLAGTSSLRALLHSPLGVYVVGTHQVRKEVRVQLDIATEDLDFTLHTLISTLPVASIGPLQRHGVVEKDH